MPVLEDLGWNPALEADFQEFRSRDLLPARVCLEHNHLYRVLTESGELLAEATGRIKHQATGRRELPAVGDWVAVRPDTSGSRVTIQAILPRRGWFSRRAAGKGTEEQVIAANVDVVLLVFSLDVHVKPRAIERYIALARDSGARPIIVLNKADVADDPASAVAEVGDVAGETPVLLASARTGQGLNIVEAYLGPGVTLALLGPSGAGKSSIVNWLLGHDRLATGEVRSRDLRGRHTTVHRQLLPRPGGGLIIDTPGMRELQLWDRAESLDAAFPEISDLAGQCRFRDCRHEQEPGCAIKDAVLSGALPEKRYGAYLALAGEQRATEEARAFIERKREAKVQSRALKAFQKSRDR